LSGRAGDFDVALFTDLYELTMGAAYHAGGLDREEATFDLFIRSLPPERRFLVACGLDHALTYLEELRFGDDAIGYLRSLGTFDDPFLERLAGLRFRGEVWAVPEGEVVFPPEPLLRITAPLLEAQLAETFLLNCLSFQTMVASKAARVAIACGDRGFVDFSARRDHGTDAAMKAARASYVGGAVATSLVAAGQAYGLPLSGTMAHSFVMAHPTELDAFRVFLRRFPDDAVLLIDTYDTVEGARRAVQAARELAPEGIRLRGVRLDSGDLPALARRVRDVLDGAGMGAVQVFASGDLDEYRIRDLLAARAPVDAFGVGTQLGTSGDAPSLGAVYKLVDDASGPKVKLAADKVTLPGRKQVYRVDGDREPHDVIALEDEEVDGRPLLQPVMRDGVRVGHPETLESIRDRCRAAVAALPEHVRSLDDARRPYRVRVSPGLEELGARLVQAHRGAS
jgi:nicotinate phosphoribosyltransferase